MNNNNKSRPSWFANKKTAHGENFINIMRADELQHSIPQIFRDIARGNFDPNREIIYLANPLVTSTIIQYCSNKITSLNVILKDMVYVTANCPADNTVDASNRAIVYNNIKYRQEMYSHIHNELSTFRYIVANTPGFDIYNIPKNPDMSVSIANIPGSCNLIKVVDVLRHYRSYLDANNLF